MAEFTSKKIVLAMDMAGCPNRCRHCWLGNPPNRHVPEETLRWVVKQFREWTTCRGEGFPHSITAMTWYREPDFAPNYRYLWELEKELSDPGEAIRYELLSIWRLSHDTGYAQWAREIGTAVCQISFFGLEENTDNFTRRLGAFQDSLLATERLLQVGIRPRWQVFLTQRLLPDLEGFIDLINKLELETRVRDMGHEFEVFVHPIAPDGEAFTIEHLRPTAEIVSKIPAYLSQKTRQHHRVSSLEECLGKTEGEWIGKLYQEDQPYAVYPETLGFMVTPQLDVFSNIGEPMPWWRLGNLKTDSVETIIHRYENDQVPGLFAHFHIPISELARNFGRQGSHYLYTRDDLILRWLRLWGENTWKNRP